MALDILAYKNRDKLADMVSGAGRTQTIRMPAAANCGQPDMATPHSWVGTVPNKPIERSRVEQAIDDETLTALTQQTGMSRGRSSSVLPRIYLRPLTK